MLTDEQVKNWRNAMVNVLGPYALIMPREDIEKMRANVQKNLEQFEKEQP